MKLKHDLTNTRFGRLFVVCRENSDSVKVHWHCWCDCGAESIVRSDSLKSGAIQSCGCLGKERRAAASSIKSVTHGLTKGKRGEQRQPPEYRTWSGMRQRCSNPKNPKFKDYGGRGITVCERWHSFENFLSDMGSRPPGTSIDRINVNGNYEPGNCRWADAKTQRSNRRDSTKAATA